MSSLSEFALREQRPVRNSTARWLMNHGHLLSELFEGKKHGVPYATMYRWLKAEHGYPFSRTAFSQWCLAAFPEAFPQEAEGAG